MKASQTFGSWDQKIYSKFMNHKPLIPTLDWLKAVSTTFLLVCFFSLKESTYEVTRNVFLFHFTSKGSFCFQENFKFLDIQIL